MAYTAFTLSQIRSGKSALYTLFDLLRTNFIDHETRIVTLESALAVVDTGIVLPFGGATAPVGYILCDGSAVSRTTYADLFAVCSTNFNIGGEAATDFRVPDLRGRVPIGTGTGSGLTARSLGALTGTENHTLVTAEIPSHTHAIQGDSHTHSWPSVSGASAGVGQRTDAATYATTDTTTNSAGISIASTGGDTTHNNMQPSTVVGFIIKT